MRGVVPGGWNRSRGVGRGGRAGGGEVLGLRWSDVDLKGRQLQVARQLPVERGKPVLTQLKTEQSVRLVTFGQTTAEVLAAHRRRQLAEAEFVGGAWIDSGLVFSTALGGFIDTNNFRRLMDSLVADAGVPRITPKGLRHTAQSVGRLVVGDDKVMQERLGPRRHRHHPWHLHPHADRTASPAGDRLDEVFAGPAERK